MLQYDTPSAILSNPADETVAGFIGDDASLKQLTLASVDDIPLAQATTARESESPAELAARATGEDEWCVVLDDHGRPRRWVMASTLNGVSDLRTAGQPADGQVTAGSTLQEALDKLLSTASATTVVVDADGVYRGVLGISDVVDALRRMRRRDGVEAPA